jgi:hypothetical protein
MVMKVVIIVQLDLVDCTLVAYTPNNRSKRYMHVGCRHQIGEIPLLVGAQLVFGKWCRYL